MSEFKLRPEEARAVLVKALRSGEYNQGTGKLRDINDCFCCLGVACEVFAKTEGQGIWKAEETGPYQFFAETSDLHGAAHFLPSIVMRWLGFNTAKGHLTNTSLDDPKNLVSENDNGATFKQIASRIENGEVLLSPQDGE